MTLNLGSLNCASPPAHLLDTLHVALISQGRVAEAACVYNPAVYARVSFILPTPSPETPVTPVTLHHLSQGYLVGATLLSTDTYASVVFTLPNPTPCDQWTTLRALHTSAANPNATTTPSCISSRPLVPTPARPEEPTPTPSPVTYPANPHVTPTPSSARPIATATRAVRGATTSATDQETLVHEIAALIDSTHSFLEDLVSLSTEVVAKLSVRTTV